MTIPPPEAWEDAIPPYGIRTPKPLAPARHLATALHRTAEDVSAALVMFGVPPVVTGATVVAGSAAARDAHWGVPGSAGARLALQAQGATTIRTDTGWTERYFAAATDGGTNPGGTPTAGWYPVAGRLPKVKVEPAAGQVTSPSVSVYTAIRYETEHYDNAGMHGTGTPTRLVAPVAGYYLATARQRVNAAAPASGNLALAVNGTLRPETLTSMNSTVSNVFIDTLDHVYLAAGDYVEVHVASSAPSQAVASGMATLAYWGP